MYKGNFEELFIYAESKKLFKKYYKLLEKTKDYFLKDQLLRAILSISNNIAEGYERETDKEFIRFLYIAKGSCGEVRNMLNLMKDLGILEGNDLEDDIDMTLKVSSGLKIL